MAVNTLYQNQVQTMYIAYFGRPADPTGLDYYTNLMASRGGSYDAMNSDFFSSDEGNGLYGSLGLNAKVNAFYQNLFGHDADAEGLAYWVGQINAGLVTLPNAAYTIGYNAQPADMAILNAKQGTAATWTSHLDQTPEILAYESNTGAGRTFLSTVTTSTAGTPAAVDASIAAMVNNTTVSAGQTFTLTTGTDTSGVIVGSLGNTGTSGNDTFAGTMDNTGGTITGSFNAGDTLTGGSGTDALNITFTGDTASALIAPSVSGIETINIRALSSGGLTVNAGNFVGATTFASDRSTSVVTVSNMAAGSTFEVKGNTAIVNGNSNFTYVNPSTANIAISGGTLGGNITQTNAAFATNTISSTGASNIVGTIDLGNDTAVTGLTINAATALNASLAAGDFAANSTLTLAGAAANTTLVSTGAATAAVDLAGAALASTIISVNASGLTGGGASVILNANTTAFVGGQGNDTVNIGNFVFNGSTVVAAGAGTGDTLVINDQAALTSVTAANLTGFETLRLADDDDGVLDTFNLSLLTGITSLQLNADSGADGYSITNMNATQAGAVTIRGSQAVAPTFGLTGASTVGQLDTLSLTISDGLTAKNSFTMANVNAAGVETVNITATDNVTISSMTGLGAITNSTITGVGDVSLTTGALAANVNTVINASAVTGTVTVDATSATANGLAITGSATAINTLTGSAQADVITGGASNDTLVGLAGSDTINGGGGNDTTTGGAGADKINVGTGTDTVLYTATGETFGGVITSGVTGLSAAIDVLTGMGTGDTITLTSTLATAVDWTSATAISSTIIAAGAVDTIALVRGNYVAGTGLFTASATGADTLLQWDNNGTTAAGTIESVVLVGTTNTTATMGVDTLVLV